MKLSELLKILKKNDCYLVRHGDNHDIWYSPKSGKKFSVPRHAKEIKTGTKESIFKDAGLK
jgi:hypothetical protein rflaF_18601|nr:MAG TPA: hypothetical protein [Caudoviricetes sp.]DAS14629.1 MAG TPA: hypothetical protein [Caudoviricetes sp.]